ncbi:hypothetical protein QZH41_007627 [Actinostola sp. cb2023]|nr:hypothetical protein QZH41_007627 [Actinostola sp. cb2023]
MPKYQCPFPDCTYETEDVADSLAAVLISVHSSGTHTANATSTSGNGAAKIERVRRPTISTAGSSEDWSYFHTRWQDYIDATKITGKEKVVQLLECCDEQLRKDLTRNTGGSLTNKPIEDVMSAIRKLAVREESTMVARVQLHNMHQDRHETVRSFGARLRGQAGVCKFTTQCLECNASVNYTEHILRDVLTRGLSDSEIQLDLLGDKNQDMTLEEVLQFVEAKESVKRSVGRLLQTQGAEAARSQYRSTKQMELKNRRPDNHKPDPCHYCGKHGHGNNSPTRIRKSECPAYGKTCDHCGRANHFAAVCQAKSQPGKRPSNFTSPSNLVTEGAIFDTLCTVTNSSQDQSVGAITLDHHLYNHLNDCWVRKTSQPQPFLTLTASIYPDDYTALGFKPISQQPQSIQLSAMADTGCQSCLTSMTVVRRLGLSKKDLIPVSTRMHAANNNGIEILGAIILRFSGKSKSNQIRETRQIVYVTDDADKLFLSRET